jgi:nascent polypeptide-associated complex subunit alpha
MDVRNLQKMMKQMNTEELPAERVDILLEGGKILRIAKPSVVKMQIMGQVTFQVSGDATEVDGAAPDESYSDEGDVRLVVAGCGCTDEEAKKALAESRGDIAAAILKIKGQSA